MCSSCFPLPRRVSISLSLTWFALLSSSLRTHLAFLPFFRPSAPTPSLCCLAAAGSRSLVPVRCCSSALLSLGLVSRQAKVQCLNQKLTSFSYFSSFFSFFFFSFSLALLLSYLLLPKLACPPGGIKHRYSGVSLL